MPAAKQKKQASKKPKRMPEGIQPMLATLVDNPFDEPGWQYEIKWDGYRALAYIDNGHVTLQSRNQKSFDEKFYSIHHALSSWKIRAITDGEIVVVTQDGTSNFSALQNWRSEADGELVYYIFDVLWLNGENLMEWPLEKRRQLLQQMAPEIPGIKISESFTTNATEFYDAATKLHLEGIIAKKTDSKYYPGQRSREWLKIKIQKRHEVVIGGYTHNAGSSKPFSALLVGTYDNGILEYKGKVGTGFSDKHQRELLQKFKPLIVKNCRFKNEPDINKPSRFRPNPPNATPVWLQPVLVCEVSYAEITSDGVMRHPSFEGLREDKNAPDVTGETKESSRKVIKENKTMAKIKVKYLHTDSETPSQAAKDAVRKTLLNPSEKSQTKKINGHLITFNNLDKIFYPKVKVSKRDVINYYYQVAPFMLPYMKDRPQTLIRYPNGINGKCFYQKDITGKVPDWVKQFPYRSEAGGSRNFLVVTNEASLLLIASMGGIEMHPWSSRAAKPDHPDWCIIDLDPGESSTFSQVISAANTTREVLEAIDIPSYCKTSGATGLHIYIPMGALYTYEQSKELARVLVTLIHKKIPSFTSIERAVKDREGKLYLDFLQNRPQATLAAPYSMRPKPDATVSTPLHWDEVKKGLKMQDFTIANLVARLQKEGDIFKEVLGKGIHLKKALAKLTKTFGEQPMHKSLLV